LGPDQLWMVKPGENANRGEGVCVCQDAEEVTEEVRALTQDSDY